jgi:hypothetical protein
MTKKEDTMTNTRDELSTIPTADLDSVTGGNPTPTTTTNPPPPPPPTTTLPSSPTMSHMKEHP